MCHMAHILPIVWAIAKLNVTRRRITALVYNP